jgi:hypothetical protein
MQRGEGKYERNLAPTGEISQSIDVKQSTSNNRRQTIDVKQRIVARISYQAAAGKIERQSFPARTPEPA